ncbi:MAG: D-arabinono-1,4-lactone oxidase [Motilibacteraceae bacterium]
MSTTNWAGNVVFAARRVLRPTSTDELREMVGGSGSVRVLGTGHSFSALADTTGDLVSLAGLVPEADPARGVVVDAGRPVASVPAALRYGDLATVLHAQGWALPTMASLPHISVAGAVATGTHGSGQGLGNLATQVCAVELVTADGGTRLLRRGEPDFDGAVVALGALGAVTRLELDLVPSFHVRQDLFVALPWTSLLDRFEEVVTAAYSVSVFTDWQGDDVGQVWLKSRADAGQSAGLEHLGAARADRPLHPVPGMPAENCTQQLGVPGPWHERLPHFRLGFTPSSGDELQSEWFVRRTDAPAALEAVRALRDVVGPVLQVSEIRTIAADELWLSPAHRRDAVALHFTWVGDVDAVLPVVARLEEVLEPFDARPHWGKVSLTAPDTVRGLYDRVSDFAALMTRYDPQGTFRNELLDVWFPRP